MYWQTWPIQRTNNCSAFSTRLSSEDDRSSERASHQGTGHTSHDRSGKASDPGLGTYVRFGLMILTSSVVMYIVMYLNTYSIDHVFWSWTRFFMTMMSAATMTVVMLTFMLGMYRNRMVNAVIVDRLVWLMVMKNLQLTWVLMIK